MKLFLLGAVSMLALEIILVLLIVPLLNRRTKGL